MRQWPVRLRVPVLLARIYLNVRVWFVDVGHGSITVEVEFQRGITLLQLLDRILPVMY